MKPNSRDPRSGFSGTPAARPGGRGIPVIIITGALGAGKTTLIRALLDTPEGANSAVIVNEFGEIGIDDALLRSGSEATVLLGNGCLCCRQSSDIDATLRALFIDRRRGAIPSFARVLIETSGLAELRGPDLLRAKGLLAVQGVTRPVVVHYVQHLAHPRMELSAWPDGPRHSRLVFITRNIERHAVAGLFAAITRLQPDAKEENTDG